MTETLESTDQPQPTLDLRSGTNWRIVLLFTAVISVLGGTAMALTSFGALDLQSHFAAESWWPDIIAASLGVSAGAGSIVLAARIFRASLDEDPDHLRASGVSFEDAATMMLEGNTDNQSDQTGPESESSLVRNTLIFITFSILVSSATIVVLGNLLARSWGVEAAGRPSTGLGACLASIAAVSLSGILKHHGRYKPLKPSS